MTVAQARGTSARFTQGRLFPYEALTIVVGIEKGAVTVAPPILEERWSVGRAFRVTGPTVTASGLVLLLGCGLFGYAVWTRGRDRRYQGSQVDQVMGNPHGGTQRVPIGEGDDAAPVEFGPPEGIRPGQVGTLVDERANTLDVSATIVDLAVRGYLMIQEIPKEGLFGKPDWRLVRLEAPAEALMPYERLLLDGLFRDGGDVTLSSLRTTFAERLQKVEDSLYSDAKQQGWFTARPDKVRGRWALGGLGLTGVAIGIAVALAMFTGLGLIGVALVLVGLLFLFGAGRMPARTAKGTAMLRRVRGYRQVIETADRYFAQWAEQENVFAEDAALRDRVRAHREVGRRVRVARAGPDDHTGDGLVRAARGGIARFVRRVDRRVHGGHERHDRRDACGLGLQRIRRGRVLGRRRRRWRRRLVVSPEPQCAARSMGAVQIVVSEDARDFQRRNWSALVHEDPAGTFFHQPAFLKLYWEEFGESPEHLLLVFGEDDEGNQVAAVCFERSGDVLRFLGGTEITDYLGPVALPEAKATFVEELWDVLLARNDWASADLWGLAEDTGWYELLAEAAAARGLTVQEAPDHDGVSPFLALPATWDGYLEELPAKARHEIKRKAKKLEAEAGPVRIVTAGTEDLVPLLDRFVELHRMSEGPKGVFMMPGMEIFFRRLGEAFLSAGAFRLNFIEVGGPAGGGHDRVPVVGPVLPLQLGVRPVLGVARPGHGARGRGHPPGDRRRGRRVRPAQGRLRLQVPVRRGRARACAVSS